ncbi:MAG: DUF5011 domain-containing protein [Bacteroidales bacterium]|nr:DUF5011 domain-containing protein [Bacteroidales bacterium]
MKKNLLILIIGSLLIAYSCKEDDDVPPVITMNPPDTLNHILNEPYVDKGATAQDETEGNISSEIYIENTVDENKLGTYTVTYKVVDEAGNEAEPAVRIVRVINLGWVYMGNYSVTESQVYPDNNTCQYEIVVGADSTVNYRILFPDFVCNFGQEVYADVSDSIIVVPFQIIDDSLSAITLQGTGTINDSIISIEYTRKTDTLTSLWKAEFIRL